MTLVKIKPLSVNEAWKGRRFRSDAYKKYQSDLLYLLPKIVIPEPPYVLHITFGFSSASSDNDNPVKPFQDVLQKKYKFNDKLVHRLIVDRSQVKKGEEFIEFEIKHFEPENNNGLLQRINDLDKAIFWGDMVDAQDISSDIFKELIEFISDKGLNVDRAIIEANQKIMNFE